MSEGLECDAVVDRDALEARGLGVVLIRWEKERGGCQVSRMGGA